MAKQKPQDVQKQLDQDENRFYGGQTVSGHFPDPNSDDDVEKMVREVTGEEPDQVDGGGKPNPFNIGKEINKDEQTLRVSEGLNEPNTDPMISSTDDLGEGTEGSLAGVSEVTASATADPFDLLTDADIKPKK